MPLFGPRDNELLELAWQRTKQGPISLDELGQWLLVETAQWRHRVAEKQHND